MDGNQSMQENIIKATNPELIKNEIKTLTSQIIVELKNFQAFSAKYQQIPHISQEIGRLRELTYREVGEGTGKSIDLDEFDEFSEHIFIWDSSQEKLVGAYRFLSGKEQLKRKGLDGFYISTLFHLDEKITPILEKSLEIGRSFIINEYQKRPSPLFLLWKALLFSVLQSDAQYLFGPVSISGEFSEMAKSLTVKFTKANFYHDELTQLVKAKTEFQSVIPEDFLEEDFYNEVGTDFNKLDKFIGKYEPGYHTPILLRQYICLLGTKVIAFNIDPLFNNCLDALIFMDLSKAPQKTIENLVKDFPDPSAIYKKLKNLKYRA